nr:unnamed protein product [Callosobruchus chinensis]
MDNAEAGVCEEKMDNKSRFYFKGNPKTHEVLKDEIDILKELTNNSQTQSYQEKMGSPVNFEVNPVPAVPHVVLILRHANPDMMLKIERILLRSVEEKEARSRKMEENVAKKLRNMGEAYTNTKNNKAYSKRELQPPCDEGVN